MIFFCNQLTGKRNESRPRRPRRLAPRPSRPPCSESVSCILRRLQKQLFVVGNLPRTSARERCRRRRERAGPGRAKERAATSFSSPLSCRVQSGSQLRLLIQGGRDRGPKTKRKTFVNQDVGVSVHLAGNELIRISIFFDLESSPHPSLHLIFLPPFLPLLLPPLFTFRLRLVRIPHGLSADEGAQCERSSEEREKRETVSWGSEGR